MTLLVSAEALARRQAAVAGELAPLAASLAADLAPLRNDVPEPASRKARLTRAGGRCAADGTLLTFDPSSPRAHRCPACRRVYEGEAHDRYWLLGYQLWLAERAVQAAVLHAVGGDAGDAELADTLLDRYAARYLDYPNEDNVLGPSRPFFSTYLESIWLLQLCVALSVREGRGLAASLAARVRAQLIEPSAALVASYDEGSSNRQVWNNAARLAAARLLDDEATVERVLYGRSGLTHHLEHALLDDGTWYEGENYHLFAHRGLWYGVAMAEAAGAPLRPDLVARFQRGFATPFLSALPDFTFPARRDSQFAVSLRQWRFAELCELGLARADDDVLVGALHRLYTDPLPRGDTGRARSTAEAERNEPATALTRADLGWRSLLFAREQLPTLRPAEERSVLLQAQGIAVFRRRAGRAYVALDYGHSGGGHGHPDRLNVLLAADGVRWLDDPGTGSYVDPSLHWYRSTLAHNAPLVNGRSQARRHGRLVAYDERDAAGWVEAVADELAPGVTINRTLVVMADYLVDELRWSGPAATLLDLPVHADAHCAGVGAWRRAVPLGGDGFEDGFAFLAETELATAPSGAWVTVGARAGTAVLDGWCAADGPQEWWRATAPGPPGASPRPFLFLRVVGGRGTIHTVWSWCGAVRGVRLEERRLLVERADGTVHAHTREEAGWGIRAGAEPSASGILLGGLQVAAQGGAQGGSTVAGVPPRLHDRTRAADRPDHPVARLTRASPLSFHLGEANYRRSELPWRDAGSPSADVTLALVGDALVVHVAVRKSDPLAFALPRAENELDNEHPDTNGDGIQLHLAPLAGDSASGATVGATGDDEARWRWLVVPQPGSRHSARVTPRSGEVLPLAAAARQIPGGYAVRCTVQLPAALLPEPGRDGALALDLLVNEMPPWRERRRGQLVLSGGCGEFVYLRGDRQPAARLLPLALADG